MALRVQKAQLPAELRDSMIKQLGAVPEPDRDADRAGNARAGRAGGVCAPRDLRPVYGEIAAAVGKPAGTVRQIARRAREHVAARRPRVRVSPAEQQAVVGRFLAALRTGQLQELMDVLAPDVVLIADGGGLAATALAPVHGAEVVAKVVARAGRNAFASMTVWLNDAPAGRIEVAGELAAVSLVVEDGRVSRVYLVRNPLKLTRLDEPTDLAR